MHKHQWDRSESPEISDSQVIGKGVRDTQQGGSFLSKTATCRIQRGHSLTSHTKINSKRTTGLNIKTWNQRLPWFRGKESACGGRRHSFNPWSRKTPHAMEQLSLSATAIGPVPQSPGPQLLSPGGAAPQVRTPEAGVGQPEGLPQWEAGPLQRRVDLARCS